MQLSLSALPNIPEVMPGDDVGQLICEALISAEPTSIMLNLLDFNSPATQRMVLIMVSFTLAAVSLVSIIYWRERR